MPHDTDRSGRTGVHGVGLIVTHGLGWKFREQYESDFGVDAIIEETVDGEPTGRLIALQIKAGESRARQLRDGSRWRYRGGKAERARWLAYSIPVIVVLYDATRHIAHWQHVSNSTAHLTTKGFYLDVPNDQALTVDALPALVDIQRRWMPNRQTSWDRALESIARCASAGVPVPATSQLWRLFQEAHPEARTSRMVHALNLPLAGDVPARSALPPGRIGSYTFDALEGFWSVPPETEVYVCENPEVLDVAAQQLGAGAPALISLDGSNSLTADYLMIAWYVLARAYSFTPTTTFSA